MPLYEYKCTKCGHEFEKMQKFSEAPVKKCPECKGKVEKLISRSAFHLKGGGWYKDAYSGTSNKKKKPESGEKCKDATTKNPSCSSCPSA